MTGDSRGSEADRIAREISRGIRAGRWRRGTNLPSLRALSHAHGVSHETVRRALRVLEKQGLVGMVQGRGTLVGPAAGGRGAGRLDLTGVPPFSRTLRVASCEYGTEKTAFWDEAARAFESRAPGVRIAMGRLGVEGGEWIGESRADIVHAPLWGLERHAGRGELLNLHPWTSGDPTFRGDRLPGFVAAATQDPCWSVPVSFDLRVAYVNLAAIPASELDRLRRDWTLEGLVAWAAGRGMRRGRAPFVLPRPHVLLTFYGLQPLSRPRLARNLRLLPAALEELRAASARMPLYEVESLGRDTALYAADEFASGRALVVFHHTFGIAEMRKRVAWRWAVWPQPRPAGARVERVTLACGVSRTCPAPEAAMAFIRHLAGPEGQAMLARERANMPVRRSVLGTADFAAGAPEGLKELVPHLSSTGEWLTAGEHALYVAFSTVWDEEVAAFLLQGGRAREAAERIGRRCAALIKAHGLT